jgi:hypothetical protein
MDGAHNAEAGDVETGLWSGLFRGPVAPLPAEDIVEAYRYGYTVDEVYKAVEALRTMRGAIVSTDDHGFVYGRVYTPGDPSDLETDWAVIEAEAAEEAAEEPEPEDYTLSPSGPLGARTSVGRVEGRFLGEYSSDAEAAWAVIEQMEAEQFWPSVWTISDHGNVSIVEDLHALAEDAGAIVEDGTEGRGYGQTVLLRYTGDVDADLASAVEIEHPCQVSTGARMSVPSRETTCDIAEAAEAGYARVSAYLLHGATETPVLDRVLEHYGIEPTRICPFDSEEWQAWAAEYAHEHPTGAE